MCILGADLRLPSAPAPDWILERGQLCRFCLQRQLPLQEYGICGTHRLGSYLVNAAGDCNACHNAGPGNNQFLPGGNPYFGQHPKKINPATYLGGGRDFGPLVPGGSAHIVSRNLTPDKTGLPEGGHTFAEFVQIMRTGVDMDHLHPTCVGAINSGCVPAPFDGNLLQIMPWFNFQDMNDHDLRAIYEYLSAIPCIDTIVAGQPQLRNVCH